MILQSEFNEKQFDVDENHFKWHLKEVAAYATKTGRLYTSRLKFLSSDSINIPTQKSSLWDQTSPAYCIRDWCFLLVLRFLQNVNFYLC